MRTSIRTAAKGLPLVAAAQTSRPRRLNWVQTTWEPREGLEQSAAGARAAKPLQQTCQTCSCFPKYISSTAFEKERENREFRETQGLLTREGINNLVTIPTSSPQKADQSSTICFNSRISAKWIFPSAAPHIHVNTQTNHLASRRHGVRSCSGKGSLPLTPCQGSVPEFLPSHPLLHLSPCLQTPPKAADPSAEAPWATSPHPTAGGDAEKMISL